MLLPAMAALELAYQRPGHMAAFTGSLIVGVHSGLPEMADFPELETLTQARLLHHPRLASINVLRGHVPMIVEADRRAEAERLTKVFDGRASATAIVLEAEGLRASIYRSIIAGVQIVTRQRTPTGVFRTFDEAAEWVATKDDRAGTPAELSAAYANFMSRYWVDPAA